MVLLLNSTVPICVYKFQVEGANWRQVETVHLFNDGSGLGFGIVGGKNSGVMVRSIVPGGVADRDGRLKSGDHILQINEEKLAGMGSDQVANIIRKSGNNVKLVISREMVDSEHVPVEQNKVCCFYITGFYKVVLSQLQQTNHLKRICRFSKLFKNWVNIPHVCVRVV